MDLISCVWHCSKGSSDITLHIESGFVCRSHMINMGIFNWVTSGPDKRNSLTHLHFIKQYIAFTQTKRVSTERCLYLMWQVRFSAWTRTIIFINYSENDIARQKNKLAMGITAEVFLNVQSEWKKLLVDDKCTIKGKLTHTRTHAHTYGDIP